MYNMDFTDIKELNMPLLITIGLILLIVIYGFTGYSCMRGGCVTPYNQEGFVSSSREDNHDQFMKYDETLIPINTAAWFNPSLNKDKQSPTQQKEPIPENSMLFLANTEFKSSCCAKGSGYSNSMGCACLSAKQTNYLLDRGGNNVPRSQY